ncbi:MAG: CHC2 zinc finger domain-containing protein [Pirellulales bacterium]
MIQAAAAIRLPRFTHPLRELAVTYASSFDTKERVRQAVDLVDLVGSVISLRRQGRLFVGLCPWHDDSRPSLQVNPDRQSWKCWVCNVGGDAFSFVMQREGITFPEALTMLAERAGITIDEPRRARGRPPAAQDFGDGQLYAEDYGIDALAASAQAPADAPVDKATMYRAMAWAVGKFHACLLEAPEAEPARRYLDERGITEESIGRWQLGYAPDEWHWLCEQVANKPSAICALERVGLLGKTERGHYDRFKGRVLFPIRDVQGRAIALGGRILPSTTPPAGDRPPAKYINSPETPLFSKNREFYGLDLARDAIVKQKNVLVMEGYTDCIVAHQYGFTNAVAVLGTALGENHVRRLRFADVCTVTLILDGDEAGRKRTNQILELFVAAQVDLRILTLPDDLDPCDFLHQRGAAEFARLVPTAVDALDHKIREATHDVDPADIHRSTASLEEILETLAAAGSKGQLSGPARLRHQQLLSRLARRFHLPEEELRGRLSEIKRKARAKPALRAESDPAPPVAAIAPIERELLELILLQPEAFDEIQSTVQPVQIASPAIRQVFEVCRRLAADSTMPDFDRLLLTIDDPGLKNLLVEVDEQAHARAEHGAAPRLEELLDELRWRQSEHQRRRKRTELDDPLLNEQEKLSIIEKMIEEKRIRQGISKPTDG